MSNPPSINLDLVEAKRLFRALNTKPPRTFLTPAEIWAIARLNSRPESIGDVHADQPLPKLKGLEGWDRYRRIEIN